MDKEFLKKCKKAHSNILKCLEEAYRQKSLENVPLIEDDKHAWNTFKKFINDNHQDWQIKRSSFDGF